MWKRQNLGRCRQSFVLLFLFLTLTYFISEHLHRNPESILKLSASKLGNSEKSVVKCPDVFKEAPYLLSGRLNQDIIKFKDSTVDDMLHTLYLSDNFTEKTGGSWKPSWCEPAYKVAIIIPYRDRKSHLDRLIIYLTPILRRQLLDYRIVVTEQIGDDLFNKGRIMNAAFTIAQSLGVNCVIFHDVDVFPQDDRIPYGCPEQPFHMGGRVDTLNYVIWYHILTGGALAIRVEHFLMVNGFSNQYWGWGGEDDDMGKRILASNLNITRPDKKIGRYTMAGHTKRHKNPIIHRFIDEALNRYKIDGLNTKNAWNITNISIEHLYYHLSVDVGEVPDLWKVSKPALKQSNATSFKID